MRRIFVALLLTCSATWPNSLDAQGEDYVATDISCPTALNTPFNQWQPVVHQGAEFWAEWISENRRPEDYPLPSYNWYETKSASALLSADGGLRWYDARILVHCFMTRTLYSKTRHYHQVGSTGRTEIVQCTSGSSPDPFLNEPYSTTYDPYVTSEPSLALDGDCNGGAGGSTGGSCPSVYIIIEVSNDGGSTWQTYWEGWSTVCS